MMQSFLHTTDPRLLFVSLVHAYGTTLFLFLIPALALVAAAIVARRSWWPAGFILLIVLAGPALCWSAIGDNTDARFLLPSVAASVVLLPLAFGRSPRMNAAVHGLYLLGLAWILVGADAQLPSPVPWFMSDWLSLHGVVKYRFLPQFTALAAGAAIVCSVASRRGWIGPVAGGLTAVAGMLLAIGGETWCIPSRCDYLQVASPYIRINYLYASRWLAANVTGANVAYTGNNLPYLLSGTHLTNVVSYINIDRHADWGFHDYARAFRRRGFDPAALAAPSGVLLPMEPQHGSVDAVRPRFERMHGDRDAWMSTIKAKGVRYVFISTLSQYEIDYVWHNPRGFPIEDEWAGADPVCRLVYENPDARIYEVAGR
jgi:hypothetical protein